jgi:GntR family phosphonate transport system transcriptional regulator
MDGTGLLWQRIGSTLEEEIAQGAIAPGSRLPADTDLAARFGVNRHTVRRALQHLQGHGLLRSEKGRGTFVVDDVMQYRLGPRTRFTQNLLESHRVPGRRLLQLAELPAPAEVAAALELEAGRPTLLAVMLGLADGVPILLGHNSYPLDRLPGLAAVFQRLAAATEAFSVTAALTEFGVGEYRRRHTLLAARMPSDEEAKHLRMPSSEPVLETRSVDVDSGGVPIIHAVTAFRSSRVQFVLES